MSNINNIYKGRIISNVGDRLLMVSLPIYIYESTGSIFLVSLISFFEMLPSLFVIFAGPVLDKINSKKSLVGIEIIQLMLVFAMYFILIHHRNYILLFIIIFIFSFTSLLSPTIEQTYIQKQSGKQKFSASANLAMTYQVIGLFSSALAVYLYQKCGIENLLKIDVVTFMFSIYLFLKIPKIYNNKNDTNNNEVVLSSYSQELKKGIKYFFSQREFAKIVLIDGGINSILSIMKVLIPSYFIVKLKAPELIPIYFLFMSLGGFIGASLGKRIGSNFPTGIAFVTTTIISSATFLLGFLITNVYLSLIMIFFTMLMLGFNGVYYNYIALSTIDNKYMNRVATTITFLLGLFTPIFILLATPLYEILGYDYIFIFLGIIYIILSIILVKDSNIRGIKN